MGVLARAPPGPTVHSPALRSGVISHPCYALFTLPDPLISGDGRLESLQVGFSITNQPWVKAFGCVHHTGGVYCAPSRQTGPYMARGESVNSLFTPKIERAVTFPTQTTVKVAMLSAGFRSQGNARSPQMGGAAHSAL